MTVDNDTTVLEHESGSCQSWLESQQASLTQSSLIYRKKENTWSWCRLGSFLLGLALVIWLWGQWLPMGITLCVCVYLFMATVLRHTSWQEKRIFAEHQLQVVQESLQQVLETGHPVRDWQRPEDPCTPDMVLAPITDDGPVWPLTDQERDDLDLYAPPVGLFGLMNRTSTPSGARRLRDVMDRPLLTSVSITRRQKAIQWLADHHKARLGIMASALPLRRVADALDHCVSLLKQTQANPQPLASIVIRLWSLFTGPTIAYWIVKLLLGDMRALSIIGLLAIVNGILRWICRSMLKQSWSSSAAYAPMAYALRCLMGHAERVSCDLPKEGILAVLKETMADLVSSARINSLCLWLEMTEVGGIVREPLNLVVFYDLHVAEAILKRIVPNRERLLTALSALAELDALNSLACLTAEQPGTCFPEPVSASTLSIEEGRHPLIPVSDSTTNGIDLCTGQRIWVITGPNAAGKSTYLRMVGVNCLLAQIGTAVTALSMRWSPARLMTDVRVRDDLAQHESYFMSEVRRLRRIIMDTQDMPPIFGLIDEPFRGTNSQERTAAGVALLEHLIDSPHLFLVATHEERLAQTAAKSPGTANYHFQEQLTGSGILFDYRLQTGMATTKTAIRILEQEGYPEAFLLRARKLLHDGT